MPLSGTKKSLNTFLPTAIFSDDHKYRKMPITSDLVLDATKFLPSSVTKETVEINTHLEAVATKSPPWHEVGAAEYRDMMETGRTSFPPPTYLPAARDIKLPSREAGRDIPVRVYAPDNGQASKGIFLHFHGGGFVLSSHRQ